MQVDINSVQDFEIPDATGDIATDVVSEEHSQQSDGTPAPPSFSDLTSSGILCYTFVTDHYSKNRYVLQP